MNQLIFANNPDIPPIELPDAEEEVLPGVVWGLCSTPFTPAFWKALQHGLSAPPRVKLGTTLIEEAAACLMGGHGIPSEVGIAAFYCLRNAGLLNSGSHDAEQIAAVLSEPLRVGRRAIRYRFVHQKSRYLASMLAAFSAEAAPTRPLELRRWLTAIPGFGPKTASWVVRNYCDSDEVAILDIHIVRAGQMMGLFSDKVNLAKDYDMLEAKYVEFAKAIGVRAAWLDALMWEQMKYAAEFARRAHDTLVKPEKRKRSKRQDPRAGVLPGFG